MAGHTDLCEYHFDRLWDPAKAHMPIALDTETAGMTRSSNVVIYYSWCAEDLPAGAGPTLTPNGRRFLDELCNCPRPLIFHNGKFDLRVLEDLLGYKVEDRKGWDKIHDTLLAHCLLDEHHLEYHRLKSLAEELLYVDRSDEDLLRAEQAKYPAEVRNLRVPQEILHVYAVRDARDTFDLWKLFVPQIRENNLWDPYRVEVAAQICYRYLDEAGIHLDVPRLRKALAGLVEPIAKLEREIYDFLGGEFNIGSYRQLGERLIQHLPIKALTGKPHSKERYPKTDLETLQEFVDQPIAQLVIAWKNLNGARKRFIKHFGEAKLGPDGKLHPDFRQTTVTGRSSCSEVPLQQIPKQKGKISEVEVGSKELAKICREAFREVRAIFKAPEGALLFSADYSQVEYRWAAHYSCSERLIRMIIEQGDFHTVTCELVFGTYEDRLRNVIKMVNYGLLYGMGPELLAKRIRADSDEDPHEVLRRYETNLPEMRMLQDSITRKGNSRGFVRDAYGRMYRPETVGRRRGSYLLTSYLCQGSAAGTKKRALIKCTKLLREEGGGRSQLNIDIHDQLVAEIYPEDFHLIPKIKQRMEDNPECDVPLPVDMEIGHNLLEAHKITVDNYYEVATSLLN